MGDHGTGTRGSQGRPERGETRQDEGQVESVERAREALGDPLEERIEKFVVENFLLGRPDGLRRDESLIASGVVDSTGILEIVEFLEEQFDMKIADEEIAPANLESMVKLAAFVRRKTAPA